MAAVELTKDDQKRFVGQKLDALRLKLHAAIDVGAPFRVSAHTEPPLVPGGAVGAETTTISFGTSNRPKCRDDSEKIRTLLHLMGDYEFFSRAGEKGQEWVIRPVAKEQPKPAA